MTIHHKIFVALCTLILAVVFAGCDKGSDGLRRGDRPAAPGDDPEVPGRPDPAPGKWDFEVEFRDPSPRFEGGDVNLRYDRGGVLATTRRDGSGSFIDLDGDKRVDFFIGELLADSVCDRAWISINGYRQTDLKVRMKKKTAEAVWYHVEVQNPAGGCLLVAPR